MLVKAARPALALAIAMLCLIPAGAWAQATAKPRVIVTTDPELDDSNSLVRYLLYSPDFDTEGLIYASSGVHWKGDGPSRASSRATSSARMSLSHWSSTSS